MSVYCIPRTAVFMYTAGQKLDELQKHVDAMRVSCDEAERQLALTTDASKTLLERAGNLREERCVRASLKFFSFRPITIMQARSRRQEIYRHSLLGSLHTQR